MRRRFEDWTTEEFAEARDDLARFVVVIPVAAVEQHGPHLPLGTDAMIADGMIATLLACLTENAPVLALETLRLGASLEHVGFPGTLDLGFDAMRKVLLQVGRGLHAAGFRRLAIVSSHGGNTSAIDTAALELRQSLGLFVATASWMRFGYPDAILPDGELAHGIHGGAVETALMLHFRPDLVRRDRLRPASSLQAEMEMRHAHLRAHGRLGFGWMARDLSPSGVVGDPRLASADMGRAIAEHQARRCAAFLDDVARFDLRALA